MYCATVGGVFYKYQLLCMFIGLTDFLSTFLMIDEYSVDALCCNCGLDYFSYPVMLVLASCILKLCR